MKFRRARRALISASPSRIERFRASTRSVKPATASAGREDAASIRSACMDLSAEGRGALKVDLHDLVEPGQRNTFAPQGCRAASSRVLSLPRCLSTAMIAPSPLLSTKATRDRSSTTRACAGFRRAVHRVAELDRRRGVDPFVEHAHEKMAPNFRHIEFHRMFPFELDATVDGTGYHFVIRTPSTGDHGQHDERSLHRRGRAHPHGRLPGRLRRYACGDPWGRGAQGGDRRFPSRASERSRSW
jgi:hypothetical protein